MSTIPHAPVGQPNSQGRCRPQYVPRFPKKQIRKCRRLVGSRKAPLGEVQRARLVLKLNQDPYLSKREAARQLGKSPSWVEKWRRRWATEGFSLKEARRSGRPGLYSDAERATVKAIACELPALRDREESRHSAASIREVLLGEGIPMSLRTVQRVLEQDQLKPWLYESWIHPRDPQFKEKTEVILELYQGFYEGRPLRAEEFVICADEKPSIQCRQRQVCPPRPGRHSKVRVESDYKRNGHFQYLLAWDVHKGIPMGRCEPKNGIAAFDRLVDQVMAQEPYHSAKRIFLITDQGPAHRGEKAKMRLAAKYPNLLLVHTAKHASWTSQAEIYFSIITRKLLTPAASRVKEDIIERLLRYEQRWCRHPRPFHWRFTRQEFLSRLTELQGVAA